MHVIPIDTVQVEEEYVPMTNYDTEYEGFYPHDEELLDHFSWDEDDTQSDNIDVITVLIERVNYWQAHLGTDVHDAATRHLTHSIRDLAAYVERNPIYTSVPTCTCEPMSGAFEIRDRDCPAH